MQHLGSEMRQKMQICDFLIIHVTFHDRYCLRLLLLHMIIRKLVKADISDDDLGIKYQPLSQAEPLCRAALAKIGRSSARKSGGLFDV